VSDATFSILEVLSTTWRNCYDIDRTCYTIARCVCFLAINTGFYDNNLLPIVEFDSVMVEKGSGWG
jgi:hypothetical protein